MTRIRVDPDFLRDIAKDFEKTSSDILRGGDGIFSVAMSMPSYDGQLSNPARKTGYEVQSTSKTLSEYYKHDSEILIEVANRNEVIDEQIVREFEKNNKTIRDYINEAIEKGWDIIKTGEIITRIILIFEVNQIRYSFWGDFLAWAKDLLFPTKKHEIAGSHYTWGYDWDLNENTITIYHNGESYTYSYPNPDPDIDKYLDGLKAAIDAREIGELGAIFSLASFVLTIPSLTTGGPGICAFLASCVMLGGSIAISASATNDCNTFWEKLMESSHHTKKRYSSHSNLDPNTYTSAVPDSG